jgi:hypothetical protein
LSCSFIAAKLQIILQSAIYFDYILQLFSIIVSNNRISNNLQNRKIRRLQVRRDAAGGEFFRII